MYKRQGSSIVECSHLPCRAIVSSSAAYTYDGIYGNALGNTLYIRLNHSHNIATVDGLKEWLQAQAEAGTPLTVWYPLETPTTEPVSYTHLDVYKRQVRESE